MDHIFKNKPATKGIIYLVLGVILGSSALGLIHFTFMKNLMIVIAAYFIASGFYISGLYHSVLSALRIK